jgi:hypothetical protein
MEFPPGVMLKGLNKKTHCLEILNNIYGKKESGRTWYLYLKNILPKLGYQKSRYEECVFCKESTIYFIYTDKSVSLDQNKEMLEEHLNQLQLAFEIDVQGDLNKYLGIKIDRHNNGTINLLHPHLIDSILVNLKLLDKKGTYSTTSKQETYLQG